MQVGVVKLPFFCAQSSRVINKLARPGTGRTQKNSAALVASQYKKLSGGCLMWAHVISSGLALSLQACDYCDVIRAYCRMQRKPPISRGKLCSVPQSTYRIMCET